MINTIGGRVSRSPAAAAGMACPPVQKQVPRLGWAVRASPPVGWHRHSYMYTLTCTCTHEHAHVFAGVLHPLRR